MVCNALKAGRLVKWVDRENVIKGLECCASMNGSACRECPYSSECVTGEVPYQTGTAHLAADALALLKEQQKLIDEITQRRANNGAFD